MTPCAASSSGSSLAARRSGRWSSPTSRSPSRRASSSSSQQQIGTPDAGPVDPRRAAQAPHAARSALRRRRARAAARDRGAASRRRERAAWPHAPPPKPKVEKSPTATRLAVFGDSLAIDFAKALDRFYAEDPNLVVVPMGVGDSGFVRPGLLRLEQGDRRADHAEHLRHRGGHPRHQRPPDDPRRTARATSR